MNRKEVSKSLSRFFFKHPMYYGVFLGLVAAIPFFLTRTGQADRLQECLLFGLAWGGTSILMAIIFPDSWRTMWQKHI